MAWPDPTYCVYPEKEFVLQAAQSQGTGQCLCPLKGEGNHEGINDSQVGTLWGQRLEDETRRQDGELLLHL